MTPETAGLDPRERSSWQSCRLWSLWDMTSNFFFSGAHTVLRELTIQVTVSHHNMRLAVSPFAVNDVSKDLEARAQALRSLEHVMELADKMFPQLGCAHINTAMQRLRYWMKQPAGEWSELNTRARALRDAIETELKEYVFYQYPKAKGVKFLAWQNDWQASLKAFPQIDRDVFAATDCYCLGHHDASVFHSMRVAEFGLRALANERRIKLAKNKPLEWGTWQDIIKKLDAEIGVIGGKKAGPAKDAALEFYSGARADLNGFKDEYRNVVMHVRANYDEYQALRALTNVHAFTERLAAKIDHTNQRIRWGRF